MAGRLRTGRTDACKGSKLAQIGRSNGRAMQALWALDQPDDLSLLLGQLSMQAKP
jgi:hypothetical protein